MKKFLLVAGLALSSLTVLSAKTYEIVLSSKTKAGNVELKPGQYKLKVEGSNAIFTETTKGQSFTTPVKVQEGDKKFYGPRFNSVKNGDTEKINEIDLGGSKT